MDVRRDVRKGASVDGDQKRAGILEGLKDAGE